LPIFLLMFIAGGNLTAQDAAGEVVQKCMLSAGDGVTYLSDFIVKLDGAPENGRPPVYRKSLALRKNVTYRFTICDMEDSEGEAVLRLYDNARLILSSFYPATGKEYNVINFQCKKTGVYTVMISFKEGKPGGAVGVLLYVNN